MSKRRKRKPKLEAKYKSRRVALVLLLLAVLAGAAWQIWFHKPNSNAEEGSSVTEQLSQSSSRDEELSQAPPQSEPKFQSSSEPESESESASVSALEPVPTSADGDWSLLLVNSTSPLPDNFNVKLETITDTYQVDSRIANNVRRMFNQAKADGIVLTVCSAYRSMEKQEQLFSSQVQQYLDEGKTEKEADAITVSNTARPGTSEHHTGLALDIVTPDYTNLDDGFAETPAFKWLDAHAAEYGFILRYPKDKQGITNIIYEPWHYRYVGVGPAAEIKARGLCLEEYIAQLQADYQDRLEKTESSAASETGE